MDFRLFSVSIRASNVKKLAAFYKETFDFRVREESAACAVLELSPDVVLVIERLGSSPEKIKFGPLGPDKPAARTGSSRCGIAFEVDDIDAACKKLKAKLGIIEAPAREAWGARTVSGRDPEGNRIDLIQRIKSAAAR